MIIKIVCAGENHFSKLYQPDENEYIIGVDGGIKVLRDNNVKIDLAVGDFDSIDESEVKASQVILLNKIKDQSDLAVALQAATQIEHQKIIIYNATGNRLDHFYSAILELVRYIKYNIEIVNSDNKIYVKKGYFEIPKSNYKYVSFFAFEDTYITLAGFKYPLDNYFLTKSDPLCLSNEIVSNIGRVYSQKPIIVIESK